MTFSVNGTGTTAYPYGKKKLPGITELKVKAKITNV